MQLTARVCIRHAAPADKNAWDAYVLRHPHGIAFQLYGFQTAVKAAYGFEPVRLMAAADGQIRGVFPLVRSGLPFSKGRLVSLPYCDAGGPLADAPWIEKSLAAAAVRFAAARRLPSVVVRATRGFAGLDPDKTRNPEKAAMLLPLPDSADLLLASLKAKVRSQVKKPLRDGLTGSIGGRELIEPFFRVFRENMRDLGSPAHSVDWFRHVLTALGNRAHIGLVRMPDGEPAAAGMILCHPKRVSIPWASSLRRFNRFNPNMLLYWQFLSFAAGGGYPVFDFGRSTPGEGTFRFKKQWGAAPSFLHWTEFDAGRFDGTLVPVERQPGPGKSGARGAAAAGLSRLPVPWITFLGRYARKYITL